MFSAVYGGMIHLEDETITDGKIAYFTKFVNPAVWNFPASAGGGMRCNPREVALSSASRDNSTIKFQCTAFLKLGSHYFGEPLAPAGGGST
jgi:hypothetical protein